MTNIKAKKVILKNRDGEHLIPITDVDALNYKNITNCLLEVPQNIKLELTDSGLTLKAGSVVIVPNGTDGFKEVVISADLTMALTAFTGSEQFVLFYNATETGAIAGRRLASQVGSGATTPTTGHWHYYNTTDNFVYSVVDGALRGYRASFPFGLITVTDGTITSIDQVFNGMGYIGSTVWCDKGVKGLIPNGRNEDGTLKNVEHTENKLTVYTNASANATYVISLLPTYSGIGLQQVKNYYYLQTPILPDVSTASSKAYVFSENTWYECNSGTDYTWQKLEQVVAGEVTWVNGTITNLDVKQPFQAPDIQDVVRKTGDTMSGVLELYGTSSHLGLFGGSIFTHNMNISMGTAPSSNIYFPVVEHQDKNNTRKSRVESFFKTDGSHGIQLSEKHGSNYSAVTTGFDANGNPYTYAPHCNITNGIVTQAGISKSGNGYMKFGNGIIMQWGQASVSSNKATVTFPTAFSGSFKVTVTPYSTSTGAQNNAVITALSKTTLTVYCEQTFQWLAIGY